MADRRNASERFEPPPFIEERPHRPVPMRADDPEWQYVSIRRLAAFIEQSLAHATQWAVFEPNTERLWDRVRAQAEDFLTTLWRHGRFVGTKVEDAFFVRCDRSTMTQDDVDNGRLIILVGIAPMRPGEFVIFRVGQWAVGSEDPGGPDNDGD